MTAVLAAIGGLATIAGAVFGIFKWLTWYFQTTPEDAKEAVDKKVQEEKDTFESTGRPG